MPRYLVELYELYSSVYSVRADSPQEAAERVTSGEGDLLGDSLEYIEIADMYGQKLDGAEEITPGVRSVELDDEDDEDDEDVPEDGDDLCDLCMASGVNVASTTYCGKTIGIECGCVAECGGTCGDEDCDICSRGLSE